MPFQESYIQEGCTDTNELIVNHGSPESYIERFEENIVKVLIGYGGSPDSDYALKELEPSGLPPKVQAIILCIAPPLHPDNYALSAIGLARDAKRFAVAAHADCTVEIVRKKPRRLR